MPAKKAGDEEINALAEGEEVAESENEQSEQEDEYLNPAEEEDQQDIGDTYMGFGSRSTSPRIVVQMFTEEKRLEMDLEGLWDYRNTRRMRKEENADEQFEMRMEESEEVEKRELEVESKSETESREDKRGLGEIRDMRGEGT